MWGFPYHKQHYCTNLSGKRSCPAFSRLDIDDINAKTVFASTVKPALRATHKFSMAVSLSFSNAVTDAEAGRLLESPVTENYDTC